MEGQLIVETASLTRPSTFLGEDFFYFNDLNENVCKGIR